MGGAWLIVVDCCCYCLLLLVTHRRHLTCVGGTIAELQNLSNPFPSRLFPTPRHRTAARVGGLCTESIGVEGRSRRVPRTGSTGILEGQLAQRPESGRQFGYQLFVHGLLQTSSSGAIFGNTIRPTPINDGSTNPSETITLDKFRFGWIGRCYLHNTSVSV